MKKLIIFFSVFIFIISQGFSQTELWGVTFDGGNYGGGILFNNNTEGTNFQLKHSFDICEGGSPQFTCLCQADNGKLYGLTAEGGDHSGGVLFEYDPIKQDYKIQYHFNPANECCMPFGSLLTATNGKLYGLATLGGTANAGGIFEFDPESEQLNFLFEFSGTMGENPFGSFMQAEDGFLYGMTRFGGVNGEGVLFRYDPLGNTYLKIHDFEILSGNGPIESVTQAANGKLYGVTIGGGTYGHGVLFEYNLENSNYSVLHDFTGAEGSMPYTSLMIASNGLMYGSCFYGGSNNLGVLFEYNVSSNAFNVLHHMEASSGSFPIGSLVEGEGNIIYGSCREGGSQAYGGIYSYDLDNNVYNLEYSLYDYDGIYPMGGLYKHNEEQFYLLTSDEGMASLGSCLVFNSVTSEVKRVFDFGFFSFGAQPLGKMYNLNNEKIYGVTYSGGVNGAGIIFEYDLETSEFSKKIDFDVDNGGLPGAGFIEIDGMLYSTTLYGGSNALGSLYKFDPAENSIEILYNFNVGVGSIPFGLPAYDGISKLYGTTYTGGSNNMGVLYEYDLLTMSYNRLFDFDGINFGTSPVKGLIQTENNIFYGHTKFGGLTDKGTIFKYDLSGGTMTKIFDFDGTNGENPVANFVLADNGKLYGTTLTGGAYDYGVLFEVNPQNDAVTILRNFNGSSESISSCALIQCSNGCLYGMTEEGGGCNCGVIYRYNPGSNVFETIFNFDAGPGNEPAYTALLEYCNLPDILSHPASVEVSLGENVTFSMCVLR